MTAGRAVVIAAALAIPLAAQELYQLPVPRGLEDPIRGQHWDEVLATAQKLRAAAPGDPLGHVWAGIALLKREDHVGAVLALRSAEKLGLRGVTLHKSLGISYLGLRQYHLFLQKMSDAIQADNRDFEPYYHLGRYYAQVMNDFEKALSHFDLALQRKPGEYTALQFRGVCLHALHREEEAQSAFLEAIRRVEAAGVRYGWPYQRLAELLLGEPDDDKAELALRYASQAVELDPSNDTGRATLAKALEKLERWEEALAQRLEAARLNPSDPSHHYLLSRLHRRLGNQARSAEELKIHEKLRGTYGSK